MSSLAEKFASGIARFLPVGKQGDDPLSSSRSAARWLEHLPRGDAFKCQQAISIQLKHFNDAATEYSRDRLATFMLLDEKARDLQDTLVQQYLRNPRMSRAMESQLWHAVYGLYWEVARGYHTFVQHLSLDAGKTLDPQLPLLTLRALRVFGQLLKWRAVRYLPASEKLWLRVHNFYRVAETFGFQNLRQKIYASDENNCSCETAYLHILMLNLANSGTLYPKQVDLLDRWLCAWHDELKLDTQANTDVHSFVIDLAADHGPRRVRKIDTNKPMRFWSTSRVLDRLFGLQTALQGGSSPMHLGLGTDARTSESLELIDHLLHQWAPLDAREQRRAPRASIKRLVDVVHGLSAIVNQIKLSNAPTTVSPYGTGLNYNEADDVQVYGFITDRTRERVSQMHIPAPRAADVERWVMHDESECGFGAVVESSDKDWLRVGALIGIKSHDATTWQLGIVRRLSRHSSETSSVGIETLSETPTLAMLYDASTRDYAVDGSGSGDDALPHPSLLLPGGNAADTVIIDPVHFLAGKVFRIGHAREKRLIALSKPIEHSEGWVHVITSPVQG